MRIPVAYARVALILMNLGLAGGLVWSYYARNFSDGDSTRPVLELRAPSDFSVIREIRQTKRNDTDLMQSAAVQLLRNDAVRTVVVPTTTPTEETKVDTTPSGSADEAEEGGELAKDWEYHWAIIDRKNALNTVVGLRRRADAGTPLRSAGPSGRTSGRSRGPTARPSTGRGSSVSRAGARAGVRGIGAAEMFTVRVRDRLYEDEEKGLKFYVHHADDQRFVYWLDEGQGRKPKFYYLPRVASTEIYDHVKERGLVELHPTKPEEEPATEALADASAETVKSFEVVEKNYEDKVESQYQSLVDGQRIEGKPRRPSRRRTAAPGTGAASVAAPPSARPAAGTGSRAARQPAAESSVAPGTTADPSAAAPDASATPAPADTPVEAAPAAEAGGPVTDPAERARQIEELRETIKDIPEGDRQQIEEALRGNG
jgi:hypothetical protein